MEKHAVVEAAAANVWIWLRERGGIAVWHSANRSDTGRTWTTPANDADGKPSPKPSGQAESTPRRVITDPAEVVVDVPREVKRFRVGVQAGGSGLKPKVTDGGTRRINAAIDKAGPGAWCEFMPETQEAVIFVASSTVPIAEWAAQAAEAAEAADAAALKKSQTGRGEAIFLSAAAAAYQKRKAEAEAAKAKEEETP